MRMSELLKAHSVTKRAPFPCHTEVAKTRKSPRRLLDSSPMTIRYAAIHARRHAVLILFNPYSSLKKIGEVRGKGKGGTPYISFKTRLHPWRALSHQSKVQLAMEATLMTKGYSPLAVSLNISPSVEEKLRTSTDMNYVRDDFRRAVKSVLPNHPICFFLVKESTTVDGRIHFHGVLLAPDTLKEDKLITKLEDSIQARPSVNRYRKRYLNKVVLLKSEYTPKPTDSEVKPEARPVNASWGSYCTKNYCVDGAYVMSPELTALAKILLEHLRNPTPIS